MAIDRRQFLIRTGAALGAALAPRRVRADSLSAASPVYVGACADAAGGYWVAGFDEAGALRFATELPDRGHDILVHPEGDELLVFARRPGLWFVRIGREKGEIRQIVEAAGGRHFYGHGAFSPDGKRLYATENLIATGDGLLGIYDATDGYRRLGEQPSFGIGPHDLAYLPGTDRMVIANGGIRTHPDTGREILNPDTMAPSLVTLRPATGELLNKVDFGSELRTLSIRHLAAAADGTVAFGCQSQGDPFDLPPLVGLLGPDGKARFLDMPETDLGALANYVGSIELDRDGAVVAATSPHGGMVAYWDRLSGRYLGRRAMSDVCGVAATASAREFMLTSGNSGVELSPVATEALHPLAARLADWSWDNHLIAI